MHEAPVFEIACRHCHSVWISLRRYHQMAEHDMTNLEEFPSPQSVSGPQSLAKYHQNKVEKSDGKYHKSDSKSFSPSPSSTPKKSNVLTNTSGRLYKAMKRRSSLTLPPKKSPKTATHQSWNKKLKKKTSVPALDSVPHQNSDIHVRGKRPTSTTELSSLTGDGLSNFQRPLPPSPPPSPDTTSSVDPNTDTCFSLKEEESISAGKHEESQNQADLNATTESSPNFTLETGEPKNKLRKSTQNTSWDSMPSSAIAMQKSLEKERDTKSSETQPEHLINEDGSSNGSLNVEDIVANAESMSMSLQEALRKYDHHFPLRLKIMEGYCSEDSEHNLSTNDIYDIHFVKHTRVITLRDNNGFTHRIPLASAMMFGLVFNPNNNFDEALAGYQFEKCSDIMATEVMPQVVCATSRVDSPEEKHSIKQNEIMVVKGVQKPKLRGKRSLRMFSLLTHTEKLLPEECQGKFTTKPSLIRLHLPQIVQCMSKSFPTQAVLYINTDCPDLAEKINLPLSGVITLCDCTTEMSLVASCVSEDCSDESQVNIHLNDEMTQLEVQVISWRESGEDKILDECVNETDLYDDILVLQENQSTDDANDIYDDVLVFKGKENLDEETYATVGTWKNAVEPQPTAIEPQPTVQQQKVECDCVPIELDEHVPDSSSHIEEEQAFDSSM